MNGKLLWNGINEVVRVDFPGLTVRLRHETWTRSDALLESDGLVPAELRNCDLPLKAYSPESQFSSELFDAPADAVILSYQPDLLNNMVRHKDKGYLFFPAAIGDYSKEQKEWLFENFEPAPSLSVEQSMKNFRDIIDRRRKAHGVPILIYNMSSVVMGDTAYCYLGLDDVVSTTIKRFNLALIELSKATGIFIVDVDSIVATHGAANLKIDTLHFNATGCRLVAERVVHILSDVGCLSHGI